MLVFYIYSKAYSTHVAFTDTEPRDFEGIETRNDIYIMFL